MIFIRKYRHDAHSSALGSQAVRYNVIGPSILLPRFLPYAWHHAHEFAEQFLYIALLGITSKKFEDSENMLHLKNT